MRHCFIKRGKILFPLDPTYHSTYFVGTCTCYSYPLSIVTCVKVTRFIFFLDILPSLASNGGPVKDCRNQRYDHWDGFGHWHAIILATYRHLRLQFFHNVRMKVFFISIFPFLLLQKIKQSRADLVRFHSNGDADGKRHLRNMKKKTSSFSSSYFNVTGNDAVGISADENTTNIIYTVAGDGGRARISGDFNLPPSTFPPPKLNPPPLPTPLPAAPRVGVSNDRV